MISAVVTCIVVVSEKYLGLIIVFYARHRPGGGALKNRGFEEVFLWGGEGFIFFFLGGGGV